MRDAALLAAALALTGATAPAFAQSVPKGEADTQEPPPPGVFEPFDRLRGRAAAAGLVLTVSYTPELAYNPVGGVAVRVTETGQADLAAKVDLEKLVRLLGGTLNAVITWRRGRLLDQVAGLDSLQRDGRWGTWAMVRQQVTGSADEKGTARGLAMFPRAIRADRRTARLDSQVAVALFCEGLHVIAPDDALGVAVGWTQVNGRVAAADRVAGQPEQGAGYVGEIFYSFHPIRGIVVRPNVQYVIDPGGRSDLKNVVVLGLKTALTL